MSLPFEGLSRADCAIRSTLIWPFFVATCRNTGYLLSKKEKRLGTPEKPLSDLGLITYKSYWTVSIYRYLLMLSTSELRSLSIDDISSATSIVPDEVYYVLKSNDLIEPITDDDDPAKDISAGRSGSVSEDSGLPASVEAIRKAGPQAASLSSPAQLYGQGVQNNRKKGVDAAARVAIETSTSIPPAYRIAVAEHRKELQEHLEKYDSKGYLVLKPEKLQWTPFLVTRGAQPTELADVQAAALHVDVAKHEDKRDPPLGAISLPRQGPSDAVVHDGQGRGLLAKIDRTNDGSEADRVSAQPRDLDSDRGLAEAGAASVEQDENMEEDAEVDVDAEGEEEEEDELDQSQYG